MKRLIPIVALFLCTLRGQEIAGSWQGTLLAGTQKLRLIVDISRSSSGELAGSLVSLDQASDGIPVSQVTFTGNVLKFGVPAIGGSYLGTLNAGGTQLSGHWTQGAALPLDLVRASPETAWDRNRHASPHTVQFVEVEKDVKLEVLDWGGTGRPLVLLTGLGNNAHIFDKFAAKLTGSYHVYGITRRGFGSSSKPAAGYEADRLADDVLAVIAALKLNRPVLAGHSIAGEELSSIGTRFPNKVAGLIYLDAAYAYAFYDRARGDMIVDLADLRRKLGQLSPGSNLFSKELVRELRDTVLPGFERSLKAHQQELEVTPEAQLKAMAAPFDGPRAAIMNGVQKYTDVRGPILAIFAIPEKNKVAEPQAKAIETAIPSAKVVRLPNADHYVFDSNETDVLREMNAFIATLPK